MIKRAIFCSTLFIGLNIFSLNALATSTVATAKKQVAAEVFERLIAARGDLSLSPPKLEFVTDTTTLAFCKDNMIFLGEKAYNLCTTFGADSLNALAVLLSHELIHYYYRHSWEHEFSRDFAATQLANEVKDDWLKDELQADLWGGLLAFTAGYDVRNIYFEFFTTIYKSYGLKASLTNYPQLSERIQLSQQIGEKLRVLLDMFETAHYLVALGMYEDALAYYQYIIQQEYRSRELYNNIGVYKVLAALQLFNKNQMPYALPFELDAEARILKGKRGNETEANQKTKREQLLEEAISFFEKARQLDKNYTPALLNQGCAYVLLGVSQQKDDPELATEQWAQAAAFCNKAQREAVKATHTHQQSDALVLRGVLAALQQDSVAAVEHWQKAENAGNLLAGLNLQMLSGKKKNAGSVPAAPTQKQERIEDFSLSVFLQKPKLDSLYHLTSQALPIKWTTGHGTPALQHSRIFCHLVNEKRFAILHCTESSYSGSTELGIHIGSSGSQLLKSYGQPNVIIPLTQGTYFVYHPQQIIFHLDADQNIINWCIFRRMP